MNNDTLFRNQSTSDYSSVERNTHLTIFVIINCVLNAPLMFISIIGNTLVLAAILRTPSLRSPSIILFCSLAVPDLLVGLVVQPLFIAKELKKGPLASYYFFFNYVFCGVSLCTVTAISLDRFAALHYHMRYVTMVTKTRVICTLIIIWLVNLLSFGISRLSKSMYVIASSAEIVLCLLISSFSYIRIFQTVQRHQMQIHTQQQAVRSSHAGFNLSMRRLKKSSMNSFIFFIFLILCYFPILVLFILFGMSRKEWPMEWNFAVTIIFLNSSINPFLYCWRLNELRTPVLTLAKKMLCKITYQN